MYGVCQENIFFGNEINHYLLLEYNRTNGNSMTMQHFLLQAISMFLPPRKPFGDIVNANVKDNDLTHNEFRSYLQIIFIFLSSEVRNILYMIISYFYFKVIFNLSYQSKAKSYLTFPWTIFGQYIKFSSEIMIY